MYTPTTSSLNDQRLERGVCCRLRLDDAIPNGRGMMDVLKGNGCVPRYLLATTYDEGLALEICMDMPDPRQWHEALPDLRSSRRSCKPQTRDIIDREWPMPGCMPRRHSESAIPLPRSTTSISLRCILRWEYLKCMDTRSENRYGNTPPDSTELPRTESRSNDCSLRLSTMLSCWSLSTPQKAVY